METIRTAEIEVSAIALGAELTGIKTKDGTEYLWQADPAFWARRSPLLFPVVGALPGKTYSFEGKTYPLENHGFIKSRNFNVAEQKPDYLLYEFTADEQSLAVYPFLFSLTVGYRVREKTLSVEYGVKNIDSKTLYFSIGAHPAFRAPLTAGEKREDFDLIFEKKETLRRHYLTPDNVLSGETGPFLSAQDTVPVSPALFERGAVVLKNHLSRSVTLKSRVSGRFVRVDFMGFPYLGIWSPKGDVPFVCIEPWYGVMPQADSGQDITKKEGVMPLAPGKIFESVYQVTVG
jgi:galactose mutarotase-like enzyme